MRFELIDRILEIQPGKKITAVKNLTMAEEYLADHFPNFPVMPGVLMLETMSQAAAWLWRAAEDFSHSMVFLGQARNVKYGQFVEPGRTLTVTAELLKAEGEEAQFKTRGTVDGRITVGARITLVRYNLADHNPDNADVDQLMIQELRRQFRLLSESAKIIDGQPLTAETSPP
jgi:3-hydroxyacyl-[acyl-carrier-protein] dehydratase